MVKAGKGTSVTSFVVFFRIVTTLKILFYIEALFCFNHSVITISPAAKWCVYHLFVSPLGPEVQCQRPSNSKEHKPHQQPEDSVKDPKVSVKGIADPMDGASAGVLFCCLSDD